MTMLCKLCLSALKILEDHVINLVRAELLSLLSYLWLHVIYLVQQLKLSYLSAFKCNILIDMFSTKMDAFTTMDL